MGKKTEALIALALGGLAIYFLLRAKEAQAIAEKPERKLPLSFITPEVKPPKPPEGWSIDFEKGVVEYRFDGEATYDISWAIEKWPFLRQLKIEALPYQYASVYS